MSAPISNSIDCSRPRRDYASGRIDFDRINAEALGCLDAICRRLTSTRRPGSPSTSAPFSSFAPKVNFIARIPRRLNSPNALAERWRTRARPAGLRAVDAIIDLSDPSDPRIALRCWSCHADIFEIEPR